MEVFVAETGVANIASVLSGLHKAGAKPIRCHRGEELKGASAIVLPGVGTFGASMLQLERAGFIEPLRRHILEGRPLLAVCVGLQLLASSSEESPGTVGLGIFSESVCRFPAGVRVPQLGWNLVTPSSSSTLVEPGYAYFANSFCLRSAPAEFKPAWAEYAGKFIAALERGPQLACQFHPELSSSWGVSLLGRWLSKARQ